MVWEVRHRGLLILLVMKDGAAVLGGFMAWACPGNETGVEGCGSEHGTARGLDMRRLFFSVQNAAFLQKIPSLQSLCSVLKKVVVWSGFFVNFFFHRDQLLMMMRKSFTCLCWKNVIFWWQQLGNRCTSLPLSAHFSGQCHDGWQSILSEVP